MTSLWSTWKWTGVSGNLSYPGDDMTEHNIHLLMFRQTRGIIFAMKKRCCQLIGLSPESATA